MKIMASTRMPRQKTPAATGCRYVTPFQTVTTVSTRGAAVEKKRGREGARERWVGGGGEVRREGER